MFQKSFAAALLIFLFSIFSFAQYVPSNDEYSLKMNDQKKSAKQKKKNSSRIAPNVFDLSFFLPDTKDSWTLSLSSSGGFAGVTRLIAAVNSNGNYLCNPEHEFRNRLLEKNVLDEIFDFVETSDFSKFNEEKRDNIQYCMDCAYTMMTLQTRNGFVSRTMRNYANETATIKQIYDRLSNLEECR